MAIGSRSEPGFFRMVGSMIRRPFYENVVREEQAKMEVLSLEASSVALREVVRLAQRPEDEGLVPVTGGTARKPTGVEVQTLRAAARVAAYQDPLLHGYLKTLVHFVMGKGVTVSVETGDEGLDEEIHLWLDEFRRINRWDVLENEIPERSWRDGEVFVRRFTQVETGPLDAKLSREQTQRLQGLQVDVEALQGEEIPKGMTLLRLVDPEQIRDPLSIFEDGIVTSKIDAQVVLGYIWTADPTKQDSEFIPKREMMHVKVGVDSDVLRGRSVFEPLLKKAKQYEDWLQARILLSIARSSIYLFKKVTGTLSQGQAIRDTEAKQRDSVNDARVRMPKPGSAIHHGPGIEYDFKAPDLQAQDAQHDGRAIQLNMAAGATIPEFMFTGDASNANFSSTLVAEGPAYRNFENWQDFFAMPILQVHRWALEDAVAAGAISGLTEEKLDALTLSAEFPDIAVRDEKEHADANETRHRNRVLSRQGWAEDDGIDWRKEKPRIEQEQQEDIEFSATHGFPDEEE